MINNQWHVMKVKDNELRECYVSFSDFLLRTSTIKRDTVMARLSCLRRYIEPLRYEEVSWELLSRVSKDESKKITERCILIRIILNFLVYLDENELYQGKFKGQFKENSSRIRSLSHYNLAGLIQHIQSPKICPKSIVEWRNGDVNIVSIVQSQNEFLLDIFQRFLDETTMLDRHKINNTIRFFSDFEDVIYPKKVNCFNDLNDDIFFELVKEISLNTTSVKAEVGARVVVFFQWIMTVIPAEIREKNFPLVNSTLLTFNYVVKHIVQGSRIVRYSPYETPKYYSKMLLIPSSEDLHIVGDSHRVFPLDVSEIKNTIIKKWYIDFFWKGTTVKLSNRTESCRSILRFLVELDRRTQVDATEISITESDISVYVSYYKNTNVVDSRISFRLQQLKRFLQFLETEYQYPVKQIFYRMMVFRNGKSKPKKEAYSPEEIKKIVEYLNIEKPLHACAVLIMANSELRLASIMNLKTDCLMKSTSKKGFEEFAVKVHTKTSNNEVEFININKYVKSYIEEAINLTKNARELATSYEKDYIFVFQPEGRTMPKRFKSQALTIAIRRVCNEIGVEYKGTTGLRNNYMQAASNYITKNNLSVNFTESLTGHSISVHHSNYDQINFRDFFEQFYNLSIGNVYLRGSVETNTLLPQESNVVGRCGFCSEEHCNLDGKLDCFMCKSFVTTLSCIPFYEVEIKKIENQIMQQTISHEKDFLLSKKKLLVGYLVKLYELKEEKTRGKQKPD